MRTKSGLFYELTKTSDKKLLSLDTLIRSL